MAKRKEIMSGTKKRLKVYGGEREGKEEGKSKSRMCEREREDKDEREIKTESSTR